MVSLNSIKRTYK